MKIVLNLRRCLFVALVCLACSGCAQSVQSMEQAPVQPTEDPVTLNICATCDVQQRRMQATAAAAE